MENPNFRPFNDADRANEQAWRTSIFWPVSRRSAWAIMILSILTAALELVNTVIARQYDIGPCYYGPGFYAGAVGALTAAIGIIALSVPWHRRCWILAYFPLLSLSAFGAIVVVIMSIFCLIGIMTGSSMGGNDWNWSSYTVAAFNFGLIAAGFALACFSVTSVIIVCFYLPIGRYRESFISLPNQKTNEDDDNTEMQGMLFYQRQIIRVHGRTPSMEEILV